MDLIIYAKLADCAYYTSDSQIQEKWPDSLEKKYELYHVASTYFITTTVGSTTIISLRGTNSVSDFVYNLCPGDKPFLNVGSVRTGWYLRFKAMQSTLDQIIRESKHVVLTGHSLGAAIALICAIYINEEHKLPVGVVGFALPSIGDHDIIEYVNKKIDYVRVIDYQDIVAESLGDNYISTKTITLDLDTKPTWKLWNIKYHKIANYIEKIKTLYNNYKLLSEKSLI